MTTREINAFGIKSHFSWNAFYSFTIFVVPVGESADVEMRWGLMLSVHMHMNIHQDLGANHNSFHAVCS